MHRDSIGRDGTCLGGRLWMSEEKGLGVRCPWDGMGCTGMRYDEMD